MSEAALWERTREGMTGRWHAQRHEDRYSTGIPDVSYGIGRRSEGWVELKHLPALPTARKGLWDFSLDHFTPDQRNWLDSRMRHGTGRIFVMAAFGDDLTVIWNWARLREVLGHFPWSDVEARSNGSWWRRPVDYGQLTTILTDNKVLPREYKVSARR